MTCKGTCSRHQAIKPNGAGRYESGQKRCQECEIFINADGYRCPCCNSKLRTKPRNLKYKTQLRESMEFDNDSWISKVKYNPAEKTMLVFCKDNTNVYELESIELEQYEDFKNSASRGTHFNKYFKGVAKHTSEWFKSD